MEIFGPVLVAMTFRTPVEAVELANNTRFGLAASVWSESLNLALDVAPKIKAGVVWVNCTNLFDAAAGFGGYRESGFGREGGREGLFEYVKPAYEKKLPSYEDTDFDAPRAESVKNGGAGSGHGLPPIDRTPKMYVGGAQVRPDAPYVLPVVGDERRARRRGGPRQPQGHPQRGGGGAQGRGVGARDRPQPRAGALLRRREPRRPRRRSSSSACGVWTGGGRRAARREVEATLARLFHWAAWADKYDGAVHHTPFRNVTLAMPEPLGRHGRRLPARGAAARLRVARRRRPSPWATAWWRYPRSAARWRRSTSTRCSTPRTCRAASSTSSPASPTSWPRCLAAHDGVDAVWYFGSAAGSAAVERASVGNLKQTWVNYGKRRDWYDVEQAAGRELLRRATQVKNIWVPYGE